MGKAQVHALRVLQVEGTLVELRDGVVGIQQRRLFVDLADDLQDGGAAQHVNRSWKKDLVKKVVIYKQLKVKVFKA